MNVRLIRLLCLGCGLLLALPPAWCCWTPEYAPAAPQAPAPAPCCHSDPAPEPVPALPIRCPCDDRVTVSPAGPGKGAADLNLATPHVVANIDALRASPSADVRPIPPLLSGPRLHLLRCVWLC